MAAYNIVRMRVRPGCEAEFIETFRSVAPDVSHRMRTNGLRKGSIIKTSDRSYCIVAEWDSVDAIARSRPDMLKELDRLRHTLEDLGASLGVTDPVSGDVIVDFAQS